MANEALDAMTAKIEKLLAKANDPSTTEAESLAFTAKVQELLLAHNISMSDLNKGANAAKDMVELRYDMAIAQPWRIQLAAQLSKLYFCRIYTSQWLDEKNLKLKPTFVFVGRSCNATVAMSMFDYLIKTINRFANEYLGTLESEGGKGKRFNGRCHNAVRDEFRRGCAVRLLWRIQAMLNEIEQKPTESGNAMVIYSTELTLVDDHLETLKLNKGKQTTIKTGVDAYAAGMQKGATISLHGQVTAEGKKEAIAR